MRTRTMGIIATAAVLGVAAAGLAVWTIAAPAGQATSAAGTATDASPAAATAANRPAAPLSFAVDPGLVPEIATVPGLRDGDPPRPVGRLVNDGTAADLVLDELVVTAPDRAALQPVLDRTGATVVDESDGGYLLRLDPSKIDLAGPRRDDVESPHSREHDVTSSPQTPAPQTPAPQTPAPQTPAPQVPAPQWGGLAEDLAAIEPALSGVTAASSERALQLLAALAAESADHGTTVAPNWITTSESIESGRVIEGLNSKPNAFDWSFIRTGGNMNTGVGAAWQLLEEHGKLGNKVRIMIDDGAFVDNKDFPATKTVRKGDWGYGHRFGWHGTNVALAAMGQLDNEYGTAGPAGPVGELVAVLHADGAWDAFKRVRDMVDEERPAILNMSWSFDVTLAQSATRATYDHFLKKVHERGVLTFAAAGNDNRDVDAENCIGSTCWESRLVYPCESDYVVCVGGLDRDSAWKAPGSNYGRDTGDQSVEIYGPYYTIGLANPKYPGVETVGGTSFASPFVAGVAALVKAAKPSLDRDGVWQIVRDTAHHDGVGLPGVIDGNKRRINALDAVARALGVELARPEVRITSPVDGKQLTPNQWIDLIGTAVDFKGTKLPIMWTVDGKNVTGQPTTLPSGYELPDEGEHVITATAVDVLGQSVTATVKVKVVRPAPKVKVVAPQQGAQLYESDVVELVGDSEDPASRARLADAAVSWTVRRVESAGKVVHTAAGHTTSIAAGKLDPGSYLAEFTGDNGTAVTASVGFSVLAGGHDRPKVVIAKPAESSILYSTEGHPVIVDLAGTAKDDAGKPIAGTRFRWTVRDELNKTSTLCQGSAVPGTGGGGVTTAKDCAKAQAKLANLAGTGEFTTYTLTLEVWDAAGRKGTAAVTVQVGIKFL